MDGPASTASVNPSATGRFPQHSAFWGQALFLTYGGVALLQWFHTAVMGGGGKRAISLHPLEEVIKSPGSSCALALAFDFAAVVLGEKALSQPPGLEVISNTREG